MNLKTNNHLIKAISIALPKNPHNIKEELKICNLTENKYELLKQNSGIFKHYVSNDNTFASDLATKALKRLLDENLINKNEIDMIIFNTFTPDFLAPSCSSLVHKNLNLNENTICIDLIGYCSGFLQGLKQAFIALDNENINKIILICANVKSKKIDKKDKITFLNTSDSASAILIEKSKNYEKAIFSNKIFSTLCDKETLPTNNINKNYNEHIKIDANLSFSFIMENFPLFFNDIFKNLNIDKKNINDFLFNSTSSFFKKKLFDNLNMKYKEDEVLKNYGDLNINKLALDLAHINGGGYKENFAC
ncbi:3-oxoacyl-ACP synthase [Campylobacter peloridis]|uniref:3-oxoacyl-ACP synthase n=1 Tax=Campylobacter peloridis TaxID=488546 RepID=UPI0021C2998C|nr:3-oxoacyl-ACP synthase [Campylobacter peloridis]